MRKHLFASLCENALVIAIALAVLGSVLGLFIVLTSLIALAGKI